MSELRRDAKITLALIAALLASSLFYRVSAATFEIADGDVAALKDAIVSANANGEDDTINLAPNAIYILVSEDNFFNGGNGLPVIVADSGHKLVINGHGAAVERDTSILSSFRILQIGPGANLTVNDMTIAHGKVADSPSRGGGIFSDNGTLSVNNCTFSQNEAAFGGGIQSFGKATLSVTNSTFRGNSTGTAGLPLGAGIYNNGSFGGNATLGVINSTFSLNIGGAISNDGNLGIATLKVANSTFFGGVCILNGALFGGKAEVQIGNTILHASPPTITNASGTITAVGYNLSSDDGGGFLIEVGDQINSDPLIDQNGLQDNGGPTDTIALLPGSPAIDKGKDIGGTGRDQRGSARPFDFATIQNAIGGDGSDIGAFELKDTDGDGVPDSEDACPNSDLRPTVFVGTCNTMVPNHVFANGCTMADRIADVAAQARNHGAFVSGVAHPTNDWKRQGIITGAQKGAIQSCAGKAKLP